MKVTKTTMSSLLKNANNYASTMINQHGLEGAKAIANRLKLNLCEQCGMERSDSDYINNRCPQCGDLPSPF